MKTIQYVKIYNEGKLLDVCTMNEFKPSNYIHDTIEIKTQILKIN